MEQIVNALKAISITLEKIERNQRYQAKVDLGKTEWTPEEIADLQKKFKEFQKRPFPLQFLPPSELYRVYFSEPPTEEQRKEAEEHYNRVASSPVVYVVTFPSLKPHSVPSTGCHCVQCETFYRVRGFPGAPECK